MDQLEVSEFGSRLQAIMASFDFDLGEFGRFLYQTRSILSGSTMLNVVKPFTDSMKDLDVYTTMSMLPLWKAYLRAPWLDLRQHGLPAPALPLPSRKPRARGFDSWRVRLLPYC